jgi:DNA polymerase V
MLYPLFDAPFFQPESHSYLPLPLYLSSIEAGFPSPASDFTENSLDLNQLLIKHPAATFYLRVSGDSMTGAGIYSGDILIVDRAIESKPGQVVVAVVDGEFTVKRLTKIKGRFYLCPENSSYAALEIKPDMSFEVWGVVTCVLHTV